jgi:hypothetical protein
MTLAEAELIVSTSVRCTQAALRGIAGISAVPLTGSGCLTYLTSAGYKVKSLPADIPLARFKYSKDKTYLLATKGHAMALVDGILIDTMRKTLDKRILEHAWEVSRPEGEGDSQGEDSRGEGEV